MGKRRTYTEEFKREIVYEAQYGYAPDVAKNYKIPVTTLYNWMAKAKANGTCGSSIDDLDFDDFVVDQARSLHKHIQKKIDLLAFEIDELEDKQLALTQVIGDKR